MVSCTDSGAGLDGAPGPAGLDGAPGPTGPAAPGVIGGSTAETTLNTGSTEYGAFFGAVAPDAVLTNREQVLPVGGTANNLYVRLSGAAATAAGNGWSFTVTQDGAPTTLTCLILDAANNCNFASPIALVAGQRIAISIAPVGAPDGAVTASWAITYTNP